MEKQIAIKIFPGATNQFLYYYGGCDALCEKIAYSNLNGKLLYKIIGNNLGETTKINCSG